VAVTESETETRRMLRLQVIGELSNNGQPMRKFVQSFVLAPQSAKKYYVHIDIFRYQDIYPLTAESDHQPHDQCPEGSIHHM